MPIPNDRMREERRYDMRISGRTVSVGVPPVFLRTAGLEDLRQVLPFKGKGKIGKETDDRQGDNQDHPESAPLLVKRLAHDTGDRTSEHDQPDGDQAKHDLIVPLDRFETESIEEVVHEGKGERDSGNLRSRRQ